MNTTEGITIKELAAYCNQLCEEGHGNEKVVLQLGEGITKAEVDEVMYDDSKLVVKMGDNLSVLLSDAPSLLIQDIIYWRDDEVELKQTMANEYMESMDNDEKALLVKQWVQDIL